MEGQWIQSLAGIKSSVSAMQLHLSTIQRNHNLDQISSRAQSVQVAVCCRAFSCCLHITIRIDVLDYCSTRGSQSDRESSDLPSSGTFYIL